MPKRNHGNNRKGKHNKTKSKFGNNNKSQQINPPELQGHEKGEAKLHSTDNMNIEPLHNQRDINKLNEYFRSRLIDEATKNHNLCYIFVKDVVMIGRNLTLMEQLFPKDFDLKTPLRHFIKQNSQDTIFWHKQLIYATTKGDLKLLEFLLDIGVNPDSSYDTTPIHQAVSHNHFLAVEMLLSHGASPNLEGKDGVTPLCAAASNNNIPMMELLITCGAEVNKVNQNGDIALSYATVHGNDSTVKFLIDHGTNITHTNPRGRTILDLAVVHQRKELVKHILENVDTPQSKSHSLNLYSLAHSGNQKLLSIVKEHVSIDSTDNKQHSSALYYAVMKRDSQAIALLILNGADPNFSLVTTGHSPCSRAMRMGSRKIMEAIKDPSSVPIRLVKPMNTKTFSTQLIQVNSPGIGSKLLLTTNPTDNPYQTLYAVFKCIETLKSALNDKSLSLVEQKNKLNDYLVHFLTPLITLSYLSKNQDIKTISLEALCKLFGIKRALFNNVSNDNQLKLVLHTELVKISVHIYNYPAIEAHAKKALVIIDKEPTSDNKLKTDLLYKLSEAYHYQEKHQEELDILLELKNPMAEVLQFKLFKVYLKLGQYEKLLEIARQVQNPDIKHLMETYHQCISGEIKWQDVDLSIFDTFEGSSPRIIIYNELLLNLKIDRATALGNYSEVANLFLEYIGNIAVENYVPSDILKLLNHYFLANSFESYTQILRIWEQAKVKHNDFKASPKIQLAAAELYISLEAYDHAVQLVKEITVSGLEESDKVKLADIYFSLAEKARYAEHKLSFIDSTLKLNPNHIRALDKKKTLEEEKNEKEKEKETETDHVWENQLTLADLARLLSSDDENSEYRRQHAEHLKQKKLQVQQVKEEKTLAVWKIKGAIYKHGDQDVREDDVGTHGHVHLAIGRDLSLTPQELAEAEQALSKGMLRTAKGHTGIKFDKGTIKIKTQSDMRLFAKRKYVNEKGETLIVFTHKYGHKQAKKADKTELETVYVSSEEAQDNSTFILPHNPDDGSVLLAGDI